MEYWTSEEVKQWLRLKNYLQHFEPQKLVLLNGANLKEMANSELLKLVMNVEKSLADLIAALVYNSIQSLKAKQTELFSSNSKINNYI